MSSLATASRPAVWLLDWDEAGLRGEVGGDRQYGEDARPSDNNHDFGLTSGRSFLSDTAGARAPRERFVDSHHFTGFAPRRRRCADVNQSIVQERCSDKHADPPSADYRRGQREDSRGPLLCHCFRRTGIVRVDSLHGTGSAGPLWASCTRRGTPREAERRPVAFFSIFSLHPALARTPSGGQMIPRTAVVKAPISSNHIWKQDGRPMQAARR